MIARVRIAPVEQWCAEPKMIAEREGSLEVGVEVEIMTHTMEKSDCDGREWLLTPESHKRLLDIYGKPYDDFEDGMWICEHMLEMD